jgi:hypothetical protein
MDGFLVGAAEGSVKERGSTRNPKGKPRMTRMARIKICVRKLATGWIGSPMQR